MSKFVVRLLKIMIVFLIFVGIFIYYSCGDSSACENNLTTSREDQTTQHYLSDSQEEAIAKQQELFDFYHKQKSLMNENETLHEIINAQAIEIEDKERQIKIQEKQVQAPIEHAKVDVPSLKRARCPGRSPLRSITKRKGDLPGHIRKFSEGLSAKAVCRPTKIA